MLITIDGPSGSGKSTVARKLARRLAFLYVNQGAFFRAIGVVSHERGIPLDSDVETTALAKSIRFSLSMDEANKTGLLVDGEDRSDRLLSAEAGELASRVALHPTLRDVLLSVQQELLRKDSTSVFHSAVIEGRDAGSVGFPEAELKLYLDARADIRARRRHAELESLGYVDLPSIEALSAEMQERDARDQAREVAPLRVPSGGVVVDTSDLSIEEVVERLVALADSHGK